MSRARDISGERFGRLVAIEPTDGRSGSAVVWRCRCDCGNETEVRKGDLVSGNTASCGCGKGDSVEPGERFGSLVAVRRVESQGSRNTLWLCECECGRRAVFPAGRLRIGSAVRCGRSHGKPVNGRFRDLSGERFGSLVALRENGRAEDGGTVWRCLCDCGRRADVKSGNLVRGHTTSCGCAKGRPVEPGEEFGSLVARERVGTDARGQAVWLCDCECGGTAEATAAELRYGSVTSCGCGTTKKKRAMEANGAVDGTRLSLLGSKPPKNNTSGVRGVVADKRRGGWVAQIKFRGKNHYLGHFATIAEAAEARREAEQELFDSVLEEHGRAATSEEEYRSALEAAITREAEERSEAEAARADLMSDDA